jgi:Flp pilus assembly secretin CpaC
MRSVLTILVLLTTLHFAIADETTTAKPQNPPSAPAVSRTAKIEHLLKAAEHLEAAGLKDEAQKIRRQADQEKAAAAGDIEALQEQSERLRELTTDAPQVLLHLCVLELSRTKLRAAGFDLSDGPLNRPRSVLDALLEHGDRKSVGAPHSGDKSGPTQLHLLDSKDHLLAVLDVLRKDGVVKSVSEPTIVTVSNRPASFLSGGEFQVPVPRSDGTVGIEWKRYGTAVDFLPVLLAEGMIRFSCRVEVSELDPTKNVEVAGQTVPGLRVRQANTQTKMRSGQTLVIDGLVQTRAVKKDDTKETSEEFETLILLTPEIVETTLHGDASPPTSRDYGPHPNPLLTGEGTAKPSRSSP